MSITKRSDGKWLVNIKPGGRAGRQIKRLFATQAEAKRFEIHIKSKHQQNNEWTPEKRDNRKLSDLVETWYELHGTALAAGANTYARLKKMCVVMGDQIAAKFSAEDFADYRKNRMAAGISPSTLNREHAYLRSVFNELIRIENWRRANPLNNLRQFKTQESELSYLTSDLIKTLFVELGKSPNTHVALIAKICLATGARWSEAESLHSHQVTASGIQYINTKGKKTRTIPISRELSDELALHIKNRRDEKKKGARFQIFEPAYNAFRYAIRQAGIELPDGQLTHVLRHTFASHFMIGGGNILTLQRVLGHQSITMTMRYAHLAPDHLREVLQLNPLSLNKNDLKK